jgi:hypothetical protein
MQTPKELLSRYIKLSKFRKSGTKRIIHKPTKKDRCWTSGDWIKKSNSQKNQKGRKWPSCTNNQQGLYPLAPQHYHPQYCP